MTWDVPGYVAEELLGFGASGEVWRARAVVTGEVVALKRLRVGRAPAEHERLRREASLLAAFRHPRVVRLHGLLNTFGGPVLVLDHADGGSLAGLITRQGPRPPGEVAALLAPIADALAAAHRVGLVHGDVSAGNILLDATGQCLLADLGTALLVGEGGGTASTAHGTAGFIDPAVLDGAAPGPASDVYGLAAVAVYAMTGLVGLDAPATTLRGVSTPEGIAQILLRALSADPAGRPSAATLAEELAGLAHETALPGDRPARLGAVHGQVVTGGPASGAHTGAMALTHAVGERLRQTGPPLAGGRHRSAAGPGRLAARWRSGVIRAAGAAILVAAAVGAGLIWGGAGSGPAGADAGIPPGVPATGPGPAGPLPSGRSGRPSWAGVWGDLDARRAAAFAAADAMLLDGVYLPGCPVLPADLSAVRSLAARHAHATGVHHQVSRVSAESVTPDAVTLLVTDRMPGYEIRDSAGRVLAHMPARGDRTLRARLVRTPAGWRIADLVG